MKLLIAAVLLASVCLGLASNHLVPAGEPVSTSEESLLRLQVERAKAAEMFGENHPRVLNMDQEIKLTRKLLARSKASAILLPMQIQREKAASELGEKHPRVKELDLEIELTTKFLVAAEDAELKAKALVSDELLAMLRKLTARIDVLEREVAELKASQP